MCKNKKELLYLLKNQEKNIYLIESKILLSEWIICLENEIFMASLWIFMTFIEKHLRDTLIFIEFDINPEDKDELSKYDEIEKEIEEWSRKYNFNWICDWLVKHNFFEKDFSKKLKNFYKNLRIPIHHWIYKRLVNYQNNNFKDKVQKIEIINWEIISKSFEMEQSSIISRGKILPDIFEYYNYEMVEIIIKILEKYHKKWKIE